MAVRGVLLDIDGVLTVSWEPLPGAAEALTELTRRKIPFRLITNTSSRTRAEMSRLLADAGIGIGADAVHTAVSAAAHHLAEHHPDARVLVVNDGVLRPDLGNVDVTDEDDVDVVLLGGAGAATGYAEFDRAFRAVRNGAALLALHRNTRNRTADGPAWTWARSLGIEAATGVEATSWASRPRRCSTLRWRRVSPPRTP